MELPPDFGKLAAGPVGSLVALLWLPGTWARRVSMFLAGWAMSHYVAPPLTEWLPYLSEGFAGFLVGLLGVAVVSKLFDTWVQFDLGTLLKAWVSRKLGLDKPL